ncbi:DUF2283 domain-containing protein [Candidatus Thiosymbion oneisti]|uniref:DUF2283 domain-containing protein n=1 Tax=Candidatus Thiosymbion oneisti TaxID=589554 RepID=UPI00105E4715|nr:DUF2283 domain-containing protein [Candidatus Thiosymbion oneisti]
MSKYKMNYFSDEDVLHVLIEEGREAECRELAPNITAELNERGEVMGIEILKASEFIQNIVFKYPALTGLKIAR